MRRRHCIGYSRFKAFRYVVAPLGLRFSFASLANNLVDLTKATTVAYAIGVAELYVSNQIWSDSLNTFEMMNVMLVIYLLLTGIVVWIIGRVQTAIRLPASARTERSAHHVRHFVFADVLRWLPFVLWGFGLNVLMSVLAIVLGTAAGVFRDSARYRTSAWSAASRASPPSCFATRLGWCCCSTASS